ncbi:MAG: hypothetical protein V4608_01985 [Bacteroidota bacterium]
MKAGVGYQYNNWFVKPWAAVVPYYAYLLNGTQSIGMTYFDLKSTKSIKTYDAGMFLNLGVSANILSYTSVFAEYNYNLGLQNIETEKGQYLYNRGFSVKLGLAFEI